VNKIGDSYLSSPDVTVGVKRHSRDSQKRIGARPCIQVRILLVSAGLNRVVSVLISRITPDGDYPLPFCEIAHARHLTTNVRTFLSDCDVGSTIRYRYHYITLYES